MKTGSTLLSEGRAMQGKGQRLTFACLVTQNKAPSVQALLGGQGKIKLEITFQLRTLIR